MIDDWTRESRDDSRNTWIFPYFNFITVRRKIVERKIYFIENCLSVCRKEESKWNDKRKCDDRNYHIVKKLLVEWIN